MKKLTLLLMMLGLAWNAWSQQQAEQAMNKLAFLVGNWQGTALASTGPGQQVDLQQHETVEYRLDGKMLLIEGKAFEGEKMMFNALATVTYNEQTQEYEMTSWLSTGQKTQAYLREKGEKQFEWGFDIPQGGMVKYEFSINDKGQWVETGQYSPDGQQWYPSFSMLLDKK